MVLFCAPCPLVQVAKPGLNTNSLVISRLDYLYFWPWGNYFGAWIALRQTAPNGPLFGVFREE